MDTTLTAVTAPKFNFISISDLKTRLNTPAIEIKRSATTSKLFADTGNGTLKVEQNIDLAKPIKFMYVDDSTFNEGCIINVNQQVIATL